MTHSSLSSMQTSLSCDLLAVPVGVGGKGVEHELCRKTLCAERVTHPLFGPLALTQINVCGDARVHTSKTAWLTENDDRRGSCKE